MSRTGYRRMSAAGGARGPCPGRRVQTMDEAGRLARVEARCGGLPCEPEPQARRADMEIGAPEDK